jgi:hypothetical protein
VKDGRERWRVVYLAFSYSDGTGVEFGSYPQQHGAKHEQWFMKPEPGKVCGMNGYVLTQGLGGTAGGGGVHVPHTSLHYLRMGADTGVESHW